MRKSTPAPTRLLAVLATISLAAPLAAQEDPAALVVRVSGTVQVRHGGAAPAPATVGERLAPGDEVLPASGSRALLLTRSGATLNVTENTTVAEPAAGGNPDMFDRTMRTLAQAASGDARGAGLRQGMIRPIPGEPTLVAPRNGLTVATAHPTFRWMPVDGATGYMIQVRRIDGGRPMRFDTGMDTEWTLPEGEAALEAGATYAWTVAPEGGRPTREQQFQVMAADVAGELEQAMADVSSLGLDPRGDGLFLSAIVYRDLGLVYEAHEALSDLEAAGGGDLAAELYLLKGEILSRLGRADEATVAFDRADALLR
ncbi:MAG: hypothetical protein RJQ04_11235 [Longimicrobiales bacterium]